MSTLSLFFIICCLGFVAAWTEPSHGLEDAEILFENFIQKYNKQYNKFEKLSRFQIFKENLENVRRMNARRSDGGAVYGITQFMDLTPEEFSKFYSGIEPSITEEPCTMLTEADIHDNDAPESFDWRDHNAVTPVKDQYSCGACFAFSTIGNIEGQYAIKYNQMISLSEQQIVDCDSTNKGCNGGLMARVYRYAIEAGGLETEDDYVYTGYEDKCQFDASKVRVKLADCHVYNLTSQETLKNLLYHNGPISIGVRAAILMFYDKGIISDEDCSHGVRSHAVLLVGYGTENGEPYWIIKNSWGLGWGEHGYYRVHRGEGADSCDMMNPDMSSAVIA